MLSAAGSGSSWPPQVGRCPEDESSKDPAVVQPTQSPYSKSGRFLIMLAERSYSQMEPCYRKSKAEVSVAFTTTTTATTVVDGPARMHVSGSGDIHVHLHHAVYLSKLRLGGTSTVRCAADVHARYFGDVQ